MDEAPTPTVDPAQRRADELAALAAIHGCDLADLIGPDEQPVIERSVA